VWSSCGGTLRMFTHTGHCGRTPTAAAERSPVELNNQQQLSAMRKMLDSIVLQNEDLFLGPISPSAGLRRSEAARNAVPVHACDWIASQRYWISSGFPVGHGPRCAGGGQPRRSSPPPPSQPPWAPEPRRAPPRSRRWDRPAAAVADAGEKAAGWPLACSRRRSPHPPPRACASEVLC